MDFVVERMAPQHLNRVAQLHLGAFEGYFLSRMGEGFLREYYRGYIMSPDAVAWVAVQADERRDVLGFVTGAEDINTFHARLFRHRFLPLAAAALLRCIQSPALLAELWHRRARVLGPLAARLAGRRQPQAGSNDAATEATVLPTASLTSIAVDPSQRQKGIGKALGETFNDDLRRRGIREVKLGVLADNVAACTLYERLGWKLAFEEDISYKGTGRIYVLSL